MPFYKDHVYPHLVTLLGNPKPIQRIRQSRVPLAQGTVLEIGVGPGVNFPLYDPMRVNKVFALEPNPGMIRRAEEQGRRTKLDIEFLDLPGEHIPLVAGSVDTVVSTFTLCTIPGEAQSCFCVAIVSTKLTCYCRLDARLESQSVCDPNRSKVKSLKPEGREE